MKLHYYVHGRGRGHATRSREVVEHLVARGYSVRTFAGKDALGALDASLEAEPVRSLTPDLSALRSAVTLARRVSQARSALKHDPARLVISDGDMPALLAARSRGVPSIAIGHGLVFSHCQKPEGIDAKLWQREANKASRASVGSAAQVAVNFLPLTPRAPSTTLARPTIRGEFLTGKRTGGKRIVCYFRDENGQAVLERLVALGEKPLLFTARAEAPRGVERVPLDPARFASALLLARAYLGSSGSQTLSECVHLGVPLFGVYRAGDAEQQLNVEMLRAAGLADGSRVDQVSSAQLENFRASLGAPRVATFDAPTAAQAVLSRVRALLG